MARGNIHLLGENRDLSISPDQIFAQGGINSPVIVVPIKIEFTTFERNRVRAPSFADVISVKGDLKLAEVSCGETLVLTQGRIHPGSGFTANLQFLLSRETLNKVEKMRKDNLPAQIGISVQASVYEEIQFADNQKRSFVTSIENGFGFLNFQIEQSHWIKNILPQLGHDSFRIIELPGANCLIPEEYSKSLNELEEAKKYFLNGDYDKTVAHCRSALDPFKSKRGEIKSFITSKSEFAWANEVMESTDNWLNELVKATSHFTSKAHHIPSVGHFGRRDAEIIMMVTTAIIAYVGKIEGKAE
jgi:hypothetical protein